MTANIAKGVKFNMEELEDCKKKVAKLEVDIGEQQWYRMVSPVLGFGK